MTQAIVNLAIPVITCKVEAVLESCSIPADPNQYASKAMREKLVAYVLKRIPMVYTTTDTSQNCSDVTPIHCFSKEQQNQIDDLIHEGMRHLTSYRQSSPPLQLRAGSQPLPNGLARNPLISRSVLHLTNVRAFQ